MKTSSTLSLSWSSSYKLIHQFNWIKFLTKLINISKILMPDTMTTKLEITCNDFSYVFVNWTFWQTSSLSWNSSYELNHKFNWWIKFLTKQSSSEKISESKCFELSKIYIKVFNIYFIIRKSEAFCCYYLYLPFGWNPHMRFSIVIVRRFIR